MVTAASSDELRSVLVDTGGHRGDSSIGRRYSPRCRPIGAPQLRPILRIFRLKNAPRSNHKRGARQRATRLQCV
jgi:hypothetical protein